MATTFSAASAAYGQVQKLISNGGGQSQTPTPVAGHGPDFGKMVEQSLQSVVETGKRSDQLSLDMVNGKANVVDVVTAVSQTELAIESLVTVRDRVISAYEEILRMPI